MRKSVPVALLLAAVAALVVFLVVADPLGFLGGEERKSAGPAGDEERSEDAKLKGRGAAEPAGELTEVDGEPVGVLDLHLGTASLRGRVTGAREPLPYARVRPVLPPPAAPGGVRARPDGTWELRGLPAGPLDLRASADGWRARTVPAPPLAEGQAAEAETIDLDRAPALDDGLEVKVTDMFGRPLAQTKVLVTTIAWGLHLAMGPELTGIHGVTSRTGLTDERGVAEFAGLPPNRYDVVAFREGYMTSGQPGVQAAAGRVAHVTFRLGEGRSIRGIVVDKKGNPIRGGYVTGLHQPTFANTLTVKTAADGTFSLDGLREGSYMVIAGHEEHGDQVVNPVKSPSSGTRIELGGTGRLELQVVGTDGKPVPSYTFRPYVEQPFGYVYSRVYEVNDADGRFALPLAPNTYHLSVMTPDGAHREQDLVKVTVGETTQAKVEMPVAGIVKGVVTDEAGHHLAGAEVYVRRGGMPTLPSREHYARTDADGAFVVKGLTIGKSIGLHAIHERYAAKQFDAVPASPKDAAEVTVRLSAGARIVGKVVAPDGSPSGGETVSLMQGWNFFELRTTVTGDDGSYAFEAVAPGKYTVSTGPAEAVGRGQSQAVTVGEGGVVQADFQGKAAGTKSVTGRVVRGGEPVVEASVLAIDERGYDRMVTTTTDAQGSFEATGLLPGRVTIRVESQDGASTTVRETLPAEGELAPITIDFGSATVAAKVVAKDGAPVSGAWVSVEATSDDPSDWTRVVAQRTTLADGTFRAGGLSPGTYQVRVVHQGRAPLLTSPFTVAQGEARDLGTLSISEGFALSGTVTDDTGKTVEDATVSMTDAAGRPVFLFSFATTGSDGRYRVQELQAGGYMVKVEARGYAPFSKGITVSDAPTTLDAVLVRGGEVRAAVEDEGGRPVQGARVTLVDAHGQTVAKTLSLVSLLDGNLGLTNAEGVAVVPDLAAGAYRVRAKKDGMEAAGDEPQALVPGGGAVQVRLVLRAAR